MRDKEASTAVSPYNVHGTGGILSQPGQSAPKKKKKKNMLTPKEFSKAFNLSEKDFSYANAETWVVSDAASALTYLMSVARQEMGMGETDDSKEIVTMMKDLLKFMGDQLDEATQALNEPASAVDSLFGYKEYKEPSGSQFLTTKEGSHYRWTMITGSAFQDRDGEIISTKAFEQDCNEMELTGDYGELLWWHCDGTKHATDKEVRPYLPLGKCDTSLVYEKLNIESGLYYDDEVGKVFEEHAKEFGASKSFWHKEDAPDEDGVYDFIRTKERSLMPRTKEANLLTRLFGGTKEKEMADNKERIAALKERLGENKINAFLAQAKDMSSKAEQFLASKEAKKNKPADDEDKKDQGDDEVAEGTKEMQAALVAIKESNGKLELALKEQKESFEKLVLDLKEAQTKEVDALKEDMAQTQGTLASLLGFQPKGFTKTFTASKEGNEANLTDKLKNQTNKVKEAGEIQDGFMSLVDMMITGERAV